MCFAFCFLILGALCDPDFALFIVIAVACNFWFHKYGPRSCLCAIIAKCDELRNCVSKWSEVANFSRAHRDIDRQHEFTYVFLLLNPHADNIIAGRTCEIMLIKASACALED